MGTIVAVFLLAGIGCGDGSSPPSTDEPPGATPAPTPVATPTTQPAPIPPGPEISPLVSGTETYVGGAYVWTDYAYDDRGANLDAASGGDRTQSEFAGGDVAYPPDAAPGNAADLIQLQISLRDGALVVWAVLETLVDPDVPVLAVAFDTDRDAATGAVSLPGDRWPTRGALGAEIVLEVSAGGAHVWTYGDDGWSRGPAFDAVVDPETNVIGTTVPRDVLQPGRAVWRAAAAMGIASNDGTWLDGAADVYDLAFVGGERFVRWQDNAQADVLAGVLDVGEAIAEIDFARIAAGATETAAQTSPLSPGFHTLLYRSTLTLEEGVAIDEEGSPVFLGPYQPYLVYVPEDLPAPSPLVVFLHGSDQNHLGAVFQGPEQLYIGTGRALSDDPHLIATLGFAGDGFDFPPYTLQVWPLARGARLGYEGIAHQDVLDVLADTTRRFAVDTDRVILQGASMGGIGAYRLGSLQPDLWSVVFPLIGFQRPDLLPLSVNLRNLPVRQINGGADPLIPEEPATASAARLDELGYDYRYWLLLDRGHEAGGYVWDCLYAGAEDYVRRVNPSRVVFAVDANLDVVDPASGLDLRFDSAYWVSDIRVHDPRELGTVDVTSLGLPRREETVERIDRMVDNVDAGADLCGPNPDVQTGDRWQERAVHLIPGDELARSNAIEARLENVSAVTFDLERAAIDSRANGVVSLSTDTPSSLTLRGLAPGLRVTIGEDVRTVAEDGSVTVETPLGDSAIEILPEG